MGAALRMATALALLLGTAPGCRGEDPHRARARWEAARQAWSERDPGAHRLWVALAPDTEAGAEARRLLARAEKHYREGIRRLRQGEPGAREALLRGVRTAPMDPALYLSLARACRDRGLELRAAEYYGKFLAAADPSGEQAAAAHRELRELSPELAGVFGAPPTLSPARAPSPSQRRPWIAVGTAGGALALGLAGLLAWRRRGTSLDRVVAESPELHPAVAYLVGSLRHELLKHRIGALTDGLATLRAGDPEGRARAFLRARLLDDPPLRQAWRGHVEAFRRVLGRRFDPRRDPAFRRAERSIDALASAGARMVRGGRLPVDRMERAQRELQRFDGALAGLVRGLVRARIDHALLAEVVAEVRSEASAGAVPLDELTVGAVPEGLEVEVFRFDLRIVLRNLIRNAVRAAGEAPAPRRVRVEVRADLEVTGQEVVCIRVMDSNDRVPDAAALRGRSFDRGLGLVSAAVRRYGGTLGVDRGVDGWPKAVVVRFFRALDAEREDARGGELAA